jgi:hypothetical protein
MNNTGAKSFMDASESASKGLGSASEYIKVYTGNTLNAVFFGAKDAKISSVYARSAVQGGLEIPDYIYNNIPKADEVMNKQPLLFRQEDVAAIEVKYDNKSAYAEKNKPGKSPDWALKNSSGFDAKDKKALNMASVLNAVHWAEYTSEIIGADSVKEAEYGLTPPAAEVKLFAAGKRPIGTIYIGAKKGDTEVYVKVPENNSVYTVQAQTATNMSLPGLVLK